MVGFGRMQWLLYLALGLAFMSDGIELLLMAYILPGAEKEFCMSSRHKGWLGKICCKQTFTTNKCFSMQTLIGKQTKYFNINFLSGELFLHVGA